jgi:O-antigen/teichoic acid export membrane protein
MKAHLSNAAYGILDYVAYPVGMLVVAPLALRNLGLARYGVWMFASAALAAGSMLASGFGDANIRYVSLQRGSKDRAGLLRSVRNTMGIHSALGAAFALVAWMLAPLAASHIAQADALLRVESLWSLRIASPLIFVRAVETVCVSTQRAFERYGAAIGYSVPARLLSLAATALPLARHSVVTVMIATAIFVSAGLCLQLFELRRLLEAPSLWPSFDRHAARALLGFGIFSWIQAVSGVLFGQIDRLITGIWLGAALVASYALCAQMAQSIYGAAASGFHFLFPYISARSARSSLPTLRRAVGLTFCANLVLVASGASALLLLGSRLLVLWSNPAVAAAGKPLLPLLVIGSAAQGLSVTGSYVLLALGRVRLVTLLNLGGGAAMLLAVPWLLQHFGLTGMAMARLFYGLITLLVYIPLAAMMFGAPREKISGPGAVAICEET